MKLGSTWKLRQLRYRRLFAYYLRKWGYTHQEFLYRPFYGPTDWMLERHEEICTWRRAKAPPGLTA